MKITARINTFNEEDNIGAALESVQWADELLVVDSFSQDRTVAIARERGARVVSYEFKGYGDKHNYADSLCTHPWVLAIDADERVTPELRDELLRLKQRDDADVDGFRIARRTWYLDRWIKHSGWYPDYQTRLYRRALTRWEGESPHEAPKVRGRVATLTGDLLHYTRRNLREHLEVMNRYTDISAEARWRSGKHVSWLRLGLAPGWTFLRSYVFKQGFRDGVAGLIIAYLAAYYVHVKDAKVIELERQSRSISQVAGVSTSKPAP
jgi:glycosyltransferase involved in cell wall biosynthesis